MSERYLPSHEWARVNANGTVVIGLSGFAASEVGDVIHVQLPAVGTVLSKGKAFAEIESVKSVNEIYAPVDGTITAVNTALASTPELVNQEPTGKGWFVEVKPSSADPLAGLLSGEDYLKRTRA